MNLTSDFLSSESWGHNLIFYICRNLYSTHTSAQKPTWKLGSVGAASSCCCSGAAAKKLLIYLIKVFSFVLKELNEASSFNLVQHTQVKNQGRDGWGGSKASVEEMSSVMTRQMRSIWNPWYQYSWLYLQSRLEFLYKLYIYAHFLWGLVNG